MGLWHVAFIVNFSNFVLVGVACLWYFASNRNSLGSPIMKMFGWGLTYHIGTIAVGSFLLALIWTVQIILEYIHKKVKESEADKTGSLTWFVNCCRCCAQCFERLIKYISKHAYVETVLRSIGFCSGAMKAFSVITSNVLRFGVLSGIVRLAILFGNVFIASIVTLSGHYFIQWYAEWAEVTIETFFPLIVSQSLLPFRSSSLSVGQLVTSFWEFSMTALMLSSTAMPSTSKKTERLSIFSRLSKSIVLFLPLSIAKGTEAGKYNELENSAVSERSNLNLNNSGYI